MTGAHQKAREESKIRSWHGLSGVPRMLGIAVIAGAGSGRITMGLGGRLAMRLAGATAGPELQGTLTDAEEAVGRVTLGGTMFFVLFVGAGSGVAARLSWATIRSLLPGRGLIRRITFGFVLAAAGGWFLLRDSGDDFARLGPVALNVVSFGVVIVALGVVTAVLGERLERLNPRHDWIWWIAAIIAVCSVSNSWARALTTRSSWRLSLSLLPSQARLALSGSGIRPPLSLVQPGWEATLRWPYRAP